ncbi:Fe(2+) transporter [Phlyctochytrium planicorne]|nr:Fe(2+) transporter [Phlyctochytrium planicorne]
MMSERSVKGRKSVGVIKLTSYILRSEGISRFWKGAGTAICGSFPGQACYYTTYETVQELLNTYESKSMKSGEDMTFMRGFVAGASADIAAGLFYVPSDIVAQRLQTQNAGKLSFSHNCRLYKGPFDVIQKIWKYEGIRGFWRGYLGYVASFAPASAVQWGTYEFTKSITTPLFRSLITTHHRNPYVCSLLASPSNSTSPSPLHFSLMDRFSIALSGGIAGIAAVIVNNPLEVIRVRHQLLETRCLADAESIRGGYAKLMLGIFRKEGIGAFYRGLKVRLLTTVPSVILAMSGYETIKECAQ